MTPIRKFIPVLLVLLASCSTVYQPVKLQYEEYRITPQLPRDTALLNLTRVYRDSLEKSMNEVLGTFGQALEREQPSGSLNNFMTDVMLQMARQKMDPQVSVAFLNNGGIRLTQIAAGPITRGKVFELMPFDNLLLVQQVKGSVLQQVLDATAASGGWPVAGLTMEIQDKKAVNVLIGGQPLDPSRTYHITTTDYVINVDDQGKPLRNIPVQNTGYLLRDAIIDYTRSLNAGGKNLPVSTEKRVRHAQ
ncbi:MAG TPA: 5'-nucleotidase C-terminal domain-containing protein [Flavisolibacter sp.]|jgi:2',3'-cyclic-nucleotide 2'-phosphodiesterase (5'-nucleotidase family)